MAKEGVVKRKVIPQNIIEELNAKYPVKCEDNGIAYKIDLKYITFDPQEDITARMRAFDSEVGFGMMNVIFYFAGEMIKDGYKAKFDEYEYKDHVNTCSSKFHIPADKVHQIVQFLISCNYFFVIKDNDNSYLTTSQAVYDYERCMHTRTENRKRKQRSRGNGKQLEQSQNMLLAAPPPLAIPEYAPQTQEYEYPADCYQEYDYPCTLNEELDELDKIQAEQEWYQQNGCTSVCDAYDPPDPVGDMIQGEREWHMQHGMSCDDDIPDDDYDSLLPPWDE